MPEQAAPRDLMAGGVRSLFKGVPRNWAPPVSLGFPGRSRPTPEPPARAEELPAPPPALSWLARSLSGLGGGFPVPFLLRVAPGPLQPPARPCRSPSVFSSSSKFSELRIFQLPVKLAMAGAAGVAGLVPDAARRSASKSCLAPPARLALRAARPPLPAPPLPSRGGAPPRRSPARPAASRDPLPPPWKAALQPRVLKGRRKAWTAGPPFIGGGSKGGSRASKPPWPWPSEKVGTGAWFGTGPPQADGKSCPAPHLARF